MSSDIIRVIRIYEFVGPRDVVEYQIANSIHGERRVSKAGIGVLVIRAATLGNYPEILEAEEASDYNLQTYACGYEEFGDGGNSYGMFAGPFSDLEDALLTVPGDEESHAVVLRFEPSGESRPIFEYNYTVGAWLPKRQAEG